MSYFTFQTDDDDSRIFKSTEIEKLTETQPVNDSEFTVATEEVTYILIFVEIN